MEKIILLGTTKFKDGEVDLTKSKGFISKKTLGMEENFYGGRVKNIAKTRIDGVYLLIDSKDKVFDIAVANINLLTIAQIDYLLLTKKDIEIEVGSRKDVYVEKYKEVYHIPINETQDTVSDTK
jgi:hypothetical protein